MSFLSNDDQLDTLLKIAGITEYVLAASHMPLSQRIHIECMRSGLKNILSELRALYVEISGENPWAEPETELDLDHVRLVEATVGLE